MTKFGRCIDELELDLLQGNTLGAGNQSLAQSDDTLLGSHTATLDHDEVIVNFTIVDKTTHGGDSLVSQIVLGGGVVLDNLSLAGVDSTTNAVDLLVQLGTVMVSLLTSTCNRELDARWMPGSDTSDLTQTLVGLTGQLACVPT